MFTPLPPKNDERLRAMRTSIDKGTATSGINILTDVWILALPIKTLMFVHRPLREKLALIVIFGAGIVATIMSIIRLNSIRIFTLSTDPFHDGIPVRTIPLRPQAQSVVRQPNGLT